MFRNIIKKGRYFDSVFLMSVEREIKNLTGIKDCTCLMGTQKNLEFLKRQKLIKDTKNLTGEDLIITLKFDEAKINFKELEKKIDEMLSLSKGSQELHIQHYDDIDEAKSRLREANIVSISVPGEYVEYVARKSLMRGLNLFIFSDNVPIDVEERLKKMAQELRLLVMGPDCGTSIINGIIFGFGNKVKKGEIGVISAGGTGLQEFTVLVDNFGYGISHGIGVGSRDVKKEIGGISMLMGIDFLAEDKMTKLISVISKPPDIEVAEKILNRLSEIKKKSVVCFIGLDRFPKCGDNVKLVPTIDEAARESVRLISKKTIRSKVDIQEIALQEKNKLSKKQKYVRGIFVGGTLCYESQTIFYRNLGPVYSNVPLDPKFKLKNSLKSYRHTFIDYGDDEFTLGRAHPMIDLGLFKKRLRQEMLDDEVTVILFDVILGYGVTPDPAEEITNVIKDCLKLKPKYKSLITHICGTEADPMPYSEQVKKLKECGVIVMPSNKIATELAIEIVRFKQ